MSAAPRPADIADRIRRDLRTAAQPDKAEAMRAYLKSDLPCLGTYSRDRRAAVTGALRAAEPDRATWLGVVDALWDDPSHREERHAAIDVLAHRSMRSERDVTILDVCERLIVEGAWWDLVDAVAAVVNEILDADRERATPVVRSWISADDLWLRRVSVIAQLRSKERTDLDLLTDAIEANAASTEFFLRKAIGWALRSHARTDPDWVWRYVDARRDDLSGLSVREATKHRPT